MSLPIKHEDKLDYTLLAICVSPIKVWVLTSFFLCILAWQHQVSAQNRPNLKDSFSNTELTLSSGALIGAGLLRVWGNAWIGPHGSSMGPPNEGSNDLRFSRWANPNFNPQQQWLGGIPDYSGYAVPILGLTYYFGGSIINPRQGFYGAHPHEAIAYAEALSWSMFCTTLLKRLVGRERPYVSRGRLGEIDTSAVNMNRSEQLLSFPSGHSTAIATSSFFMAADLSDALVHGVFKDHSPIMRYTIGRVLPYATATALSSLVMYSRIKDQRHWLSDTLIGALIGVSSALLSYHMHFDQYGQVKLR